ncbi:MAG: hypothetical protein IJ593_00820, partial [Lachnospiraceae bacterium]|nr:hypothetical protein [Lachnospiraceae bacterium]
NTNETVSEETTETNLETSTISETSDETIESAEQIEATVSDATLAIDETISTVSDVDLNELIALDVATVSEAKLTNDELFGVGSQTITLDFGELGFFPLIASSSNWNTMTNMPQVEVSGRDSIQFSGAENATISEMFDEADYAGTGDLNAIISNHDDKDYIVLPTFTVGVGAWTGWAGYVFDGWEDDNGNQYTELPHKFGNTDLTLHARWSKDDTVQYNIKIYYMRSTYSSVWNPASTDPTQLEEHEIYTTYTETVNHTYHFAKDAVYIPRYKIKNYTISFKDMPNFEDHGNDTLRSYNTNFSPYPNTSLIMTNYNLDGQMPNHDIYIKYYYEPDQNDRKTLTVKYVNENNNSIATARTYLIKAESVIEESPITTIDRHNFLSASVTCSGADLNSGLFTLGSMHLADEIYTSTDVTTALGHFKALMPNQDVTITYTYRLTRQKITLDFGVNRPLVNNTTWNGAWTDTPERYIVLEQPVGIIIYDYFHGGADGRFIGSSVDSPNDIHQSFNPLGEHINFPKFAAGSWNGFTFSGWVDAEGTFVQSRNNNWYFNYAFQYIEDENYFAKWDRDGSVTSTLNIKYIRATNSSIWAGPYDPTAPITKHELVTAHNEDSIAHGERRTLTPPEIPGYKIASYSISLTEGGQNVGVDGLKAVLSDGTTFGAFDNDDMELSLTDYSISGMMPNHNLYIEYYYEPDENHKSDVTIMYYNTTGTQQVRVADTKSYKVEDIIEFAPPTIASYTYNSAQVGQSVADTTNHLFALGDLHTSDEKYDTVTVNANNGRFRAVMPNQAISINYLYQLEGSNTTLYIVTKKQNDNYDETQGGDQYTVSTESRTVRIGSESNVYIDHLENQGYGEPNVVPTNIVFPVPYNYGSTDADAGGRGKAVCRVDDDAVPILTITYDYNTTNTNYWTKLAFNYTLPSAGGKGTIAKANNSRDLTARYVRKGHSYSLANLTDKVVVTPNENYMVVWKNGTDASAATISTTTSVLINNTDTDYNLFADFVEDPNKWVDIKFAAADNSTI